MSAINHESLRDLGLLPYQAEFLMHPDRFKIGLWSRQSGKDFTCAAEAVTDCYLRPGAQWLIVAASERQSLETLRRVETWCWRVRFWLAEKIGISNTTRATIHKHEAYFPNGSRIIALPSRPSTVRGFSANVILTEFAFHDDPERLWEAVFPMLTHSPEGQEKKLRIITTPNGQGNFFHQLWEKWEFFKQTVTIQEARDKGLPVDLDLLRRGLASDEAWAQEYECQFMDASTVLLPYELIDSCTDRAASQSSTIDELSRTPCPLYMGIDVGRRHDLTVCWTLERCGSKLVTREVLALKSMPFPDQLALLGPRVRLARGLCIDATGLGIGLADELEAQFGSKIQRCTFSSALKQELFPRLRASFERQSVLVPKNKAIIEDLHSLRREYTSHGQVTYRAGNTADGHSDRATALALALRAADQAPPSIKPIIIGEPMRA